ncbi:MAG: 2Fe-2S iron-sulfur cluster-binding protein [Acidimicrobiia bacterium]|nr:2Fe-2S iron-sulfur cluster-binding protein [Acidimicrobiia bacterium]
MTSDTAAAIELVVNDTPLFVPDSDRSLLDVLRAEGGLTSVKDGCSPQGQCGCCTVLVDGAPRVACVTPVRRVGGRHITTVEGFDEAIRDEWADALLATGGSQCGFCTPGIVCRLEGARRKGADLGDPTAVGKALQAHLCRCTGWQTIVEASAVLGQRPPSSPSPGADERAGIEGRTPQQVSAAVALGAGGFADDEAPADALVAVPDGEGGWAVAESLAEARAAIGKVQGRRTTATPTPPLTVPEGQWERTLRTSWVEPGYLETDASWCEPGGEPASALANGGAFGAKLNSPVTDAARRLADEHGRPVRVLLSREDTVQLGPKRPPVAAGVDADGRGVMRVVRTPGIAAAISSAAPGLTVEEVDLVGPPTSSDLRAAGWAEATVLLASLQGSPDEVAHPEGARATASIVDGTIVIDVACGEPLDETVLRSYCVGAAHMAYSWVTSEGLAVGADGVVGDLTVRSFGIVRAIDTPPIDVRITDADGPAVNGSDAVFAAVAGAVWRDRGCPPDWPTG